MKLLLLFICSAVFLNSKEPQDFLASKKLQGGICLYKIEFDNHTYIYLCNSWSTSGDKFIHDPGCKCLKFDFVAFEKLKKMREGKS